MQTANPQEITWPVVALEALKYLGPAVLVLIGSLFTLRHQRLSRQRELDAGARMKARELVFSHYQKKLDRISAARDDFGESLAEMRAQLHEPDTGQPGPTLAKFANSFISIALMARHEADGIEDELKAFGLHRQYEQELGALTKLNTGAAWQPQGDFEQQAEEIQKLLYSLILIQEALLEARMRDLFSEYLPSHSTLASNP